MGSSGVSLAAAGGGSLELLSWAEGSEAGAGSPVVLKKGEGRVRTWGHLEVTER